MAELVVAQHAERRRERRHLRVPQLERRPDRVREDERRAPPRGRRAGGTSVTRSPGSARARGRRAPPPSRCCPRPRAPRSCSRASGRRRPRGRRATSRAAAAAPPANASAVESAGHSACQAPAARSCSCRPAVRRPAFACTIRAQARRGRPRPGCACAASTTSRRRPPRRPRRPRSARAGRRRARSSRRRPRPRRARRPARATGPRWTCHGTTGSSGRAPKAQPRAAIAEDRASPPGPRAARAGARQRDARRASTTRDEPAGRLQPERVGTACWSSVRPAIGVERCASASAAHAAAAPSSSASTSVRAFRATSIAAVSRMSWLVAPRWAPGSPLPQRARERHDRVRRRRGPPRRARRCRRARGGRRRRPRRRPSPARARARRRASPRARLRRRPPRGAAPARRSARTSSMGEEHGRTVALHADIEPHRAVLLLADERRLLVLVQSPRAPGRPRSPPPRPGSRCASARA